MYRFNFLAKINEEKRKKRRKDHLLMVVFGGVLLGSISLIFLMFLKSASSIEKFDESIMELSLVKKRYENFKKSVDFPKSKINSVKKVIESRIIWPEIITELESNMMEKTIVSSIDYDGTILELDFTLKSDKKINKSEIITKIIEFKDLLYGSNNLSKYFKPKSEFELIGPNLKTDEEGSKDDYWQFSLSIELKPIMKPKNKQRNNKRRKLG